jgi:LuxR family transcriptional regulator, regulator of acetate metabolism
VVVTGTPGGTVLDGALRACSSYATFRACSTQKGLVAAAPREACRAFGFTRALVSRVDGSRWIPEILYTADETAAFPAFEEFVRTTEIPLAHLLRETEMVRRRRPLLTEDTTGHEDAYRRIVEVSRTTAYVAAPILSNRRTIGFLHCDRFGQGRTVDDDDRDHLWRFARELALHLERASYAERLDRTEALVRDGLERMALERPITGVTLGEEHVRTPGSSEASLWKRTGDDPPAPRLLLALSPREREVLQLLATGATNAMLAQDLVISEATVKSHVRSILHKLRVDDRSQAVARYLRSRRSPT